MYVELPRQHQCRDEENYKMTGVSSDLRVARFARGQGQEVAVMYW